jgi:hypothetical protein
MSKLIEDKVNKMELSTLTLFNHMTDEDFLTIHNAGQLKSLCMALSLDLQSVNNEEIKNNNSYSA